MAMADPVRLLCVQLCDRQESAARHAAKTLARHITAASPSELALVFDYVLAPLLARLSEQDLPALLLEDLLTALALLLECVDRDRVASARSQRLFPLVMERLLALLEWQEVASSDEVTDTALRCTEAAVGRWYRLCDRAAEVVHLQLGFLVHIAIQFIESSQRSLCLRCARVLQLVALVEDGVDRLACFYPGVCTSLAKVLLRGDFKLGSKVVVATCDTWREWIVHVLADSLNPASTHPKTLSLASIFQEYNGKTDGRDEELPDFGEIRPRAKSAQGGRAGSLPRLDRNAGWVAETSKRTAEALCAVLRLPRGPVAAVWSEKAAVRRSFIQLSIAMLEWCRNTLKGESMDSCFDMVLSALSDESEDNRVMARQFLRGCAVDGRDAEVQRQIAERLISVIKAVQPSLGGVLDTRVGLEQRLSQAEGFLSFLVDSTCRCNGIAEGAAASVLAPHHAEALLQPVLKLCTLDPNSLRNTFQDTRSLVSLPVRGIGRAESLIDLFPYGYGVQEDEMDDALVCDADDSAGGQRPHTREGAAEGKQVQEWLLRSLRVTDGDLSLAGRLGRVLSHLLRVFGAEPLFSLVFDDPTCQWVIRPDPTEASLGLFPLSDGMIEASKATGHVLSHRCAAMYAMTVWLDSVYTEGIYSPNWLARHCISLALSIRGAYAGDAALTLCDVCASQLLHRALSALHQPVPTCSPPAGRLAVHAEVKHVLAPLLEKLGSASFASSTASYVVLAHLHALLQLDGSCAPTKSGVGPVQALLTAYGDYLAGELCFRLRFDPLGVAEQGGSMGQAGGGLPAVLVAVVHHVGLEMVPFLSDIVNTLLNSSLHLPCAQESSAATPSWVLRVLASVVRQLAALICDSRVASQGKPLAPSDGTLLPPNATVNSLRPSSAASSSTPLTAFFLGSQQGWKSVRRQNGFFLSDLAYCFNEDPEQPEEPDGSTECKTTPSRYGRERCIATGIVMWARNHLQASAVSSRHLAHNIMFHAFTVLSTRVKELLPRIHDVWSALVPSFVAGAPLVVQADACTLLKHTARISGDFIRQRFATDCWPGIWARLRDSPVVERNEAAAWSPKLKAQFAALDVLAFLAGDSAMVQGITEELVVVGLKFVAVTAADRLRERAWVLLRVLAASDPDLLWLYLHGVRPQNCPRGEPEAFPMDAPNMTVRGTSAPLTSIELPLLAEAGVASLCGEDFELLSKIIEDQDSVMKPRIALAVGGELWSSFLHPD